MRYGPVILEKIVQFEREELSTAWNFARPLPYANFVMSCGYI